nr:IgE immunoglobulin [Ornithorhynchus anatinus]
MRSALSLLSILTLLQGVQGDVQLVESGGDVRQPGGSLSLSCKVSGFTLNAHYMHWIRQGPGTGLEWIGYISSGGIIDYADSVRGRFTISRDNSKSLLNLHMSSLKTEDTALYYCARAADYSTCSSTSSYYCALAKWGQGTMVTVSSVSSKAPSVFPLVPCCDGTDSSAVTLGCLVTGYIPEPVTVRWNSGDLVKGVTTFPSVFDSQSGLYTMSSQVTVSQESWQSQTFTCNVEQMATKTKINTEVYSDCSKDPIPPTVKLLHSSCDPRGDSQASIELLCLITGYSPAGIQVDWLVDGQKAENLFPYTAPPKREGNRSFSSHSEVNITQDQWLSGKTFTCQVTHLADKKTYQDSARKCADSDPRGITVFLTPPSPTDLYISKTPKLTCLIIDLVSTEGMEVTWSRESGTPLSAESFEEQKQFNGTMSFISTVPVNIQDWNEGESYTCRVAHPDLPSPIIKTVTKLPGKRLAPEVYAFPPHQAEVSHGDSLSLTCLIRGFYPENISVRWLLDNKPLPTEHYRTTKPLKDQGPDPAYFLYSRLAVNKSTWEQGNVYTCQVVHEALPSRNTERKFQHTSGN